MAKNYLSVVYDEKSYPYSDYPISNMPKDPLGELEMLFKSI